LAVASSQSDEAGLDLRQCIPGVALRALLHRADHHDQPSEHGADAVVQVAGQAATLVLAYPRGGRVRGRSEVVDDELWSWVRGPGPAP
jgi:hypothetical protein